MKRSMRWKTSEFIPHLFSETACRDPVISRKQEGQQTDGSSVLLDQGSYIRPGETGGHPRLARLCSEEAGNWEHLVEVMNVWGGENRSFWMAHYKAQVLPNIRT